MRNYTIHYIHFTAKSSTTIQDQTLQNAHAHPKEDRFFIPLQISLAQIKNRF